MKNTLKTLVAVLSSLVISVSSFAGDLSVSGNAEATYIIGGADDANSKGLGISNELNFTADGEFANGFTWKYSMELDGASTANDDTSMTLGLGQFGNAAICITECGLSQELGYGVGAYGVGSDIVNTGGIVFGNDVSSYNNIQYHTPAGLLPNGFVIKYGYAPNLSGAQGSSAKGGNAIETTLGATGTTYAGAGTDAEMIQVSGSPVEGAKIGIDYMKVNGSTAVSQKYESGNIFFSYAVGPVKVGAARTLVAPSAADSTTAAQEYATTGAGIQYAVTDAVSVSINREESEKTLIDDTSVTIDANTYQVAYNVGGATIAVVKSESTNAGYVKANEVEMTLISMKMAF